MQGRRVGSEVVSAAALEPGDYGCLEGRWYCRPPGFEGIGCLGDGKSHHQVTIHEDGTITAHPSILIKSYETGVEKVWHGYLKKGVWSECKE